MAGPVNSANPASGTLQSPGQLKDYVVNIDCAELTVANGFDHAGHEGCAEEQICAMIDGFNRSTRKKKKYKGKSPSEKYTVADTTTKAHVAANKRNAKYVAGLKLFRKNFAKRDGGTPLQQEKADAMFGTECLKKKYKEGVVSTDDMSPDHTHDAGLGGAIAPRPAQKNLMWAEQRLNTKHGACMGHYKPEVHGKCVAHPNCNCP